MAASGLVISAPSSNQGKTVIALALLRAFRDAGVKVASAKAGPDYIDSAFHEAATGKPCYNLDPWAMAPDQLIRLAEHVSKDAELVVCEGVMGLFDGSISRKGSTADLATVLRWPVILVVAAQSMADSAAALVRGFACHRRDPTIAGVVFNRVGGERHETALRSSMAEELPDIPVLGCVGQLDDLALPSRHLGLVQALEHPALETFISKAAGAVSKAVDLDRLRRLATAGKTMASTARPRPPLGQRVAVAKDEAFAFRYAHTLDEWREAGAEVRFFSPLADEAPGEDCDAVYLPGGYPELHAGRIAMNETFMSGLRKAARSGKAVFGECGGYMALGEALIAEDGQTHSMAGLLPVVASFESPKRILGYRQAVLTADGPLGRAGAAFKTHEFHYSREVSRDGRDPLFRIRDAEGAELGVAGCRHGRVAGSFLHIIAGVPVR